MKTFANRQKPVWRNSNPVPSSGRTFLDQRPESRAQRQMIETIRQAPVATPGFVLQPTLGIPQATAPQTSSAPLQMVHESNFIENPEDFMRNNVVLFNYIAGFKQRYPLTTAAVLGKVAEKNFESAIKQVMAAGQSGVQFSLSLQTKVATGRQNIYFVAPELGALPDDALIALFSNDKYQLENAQDLVTKLKAENDLAPSDLITAKYVPYLNGSPQKYKNNQTNTGQQVQDVTNNRWSDVGSSVIDSKVTNFVFTDAMNGCAYAITGVENGETQFEAWHFQSETDNWKAASTFRAVKEIRDWFGVHEYYVGPVKNNLAATNILWQNPVEGWKVLSQRNIVPLNLEGNTQYKELAVRKLNVAHKMSKENLESLHGTLNAKALELVSEERVNHINERIMRLEITDDLMSQSLDKVQVNRDSFDGNVINEFNRIGKAVTAIKSDKQGNYQLYHDFAEFVINYKKIPSKKKFLRGTKYDELGVTSFKNSFVAMSKNLKVTIQDRLDACKNAPITVSLENDNNWHLERIKQVRAYYDLYEDNTYDVANLLVIDLEALRTAKRNVLEKSATLSSELEKIYPTQQVPLIEEEQS